MSSTSFRKLVWGFYKKHGRYDLPWRQTRDPYKILVSEVMLQQTQVERVLPFYAKFTRCYPTANRLAAAPLSEVLAVWQGLGYNRRAKLLRDAAQAFPRFDLVARSNLVEMLEELPGVGPYTARAVAAFAFNADVVFVETNIRTAITHHFFARKKKVSDTEIEKILAATLPSGRAREWYNALMDYGAYLKRSGVKLNAKSRHYAQQSKFKGSLRQVRGAILKALTAKKSLASLRKQSADRLEPALAALAKDGLIKKSGRGWRIDDTKASA